MTDEKDRNRFQEVQRELYELAIEKSSKYGNAWKDSPLCVKGQGVRATFVEINAKYMRLLKMCWQDDPSQWRAVLRETFGDIANYCILSILLLENDMTEEDWKKMEEIRRGG